MNSWKVAHRLVLNLKQLNKEKEIKKYKFVRKIIFWQHDNL